MLSKTVGPTVIYALFAIGSLEGGTVRDADPCAATDSSTLETLDKVKIIAASSDPMPAQARGGLGIPNVSEAEVVLITSEATCSAALAAVNRDRATPGQPRAINMIRVGNLYLVHQIGERSGDWDLWLKYDATFEGLKGEIGL